MPDFVPSTHLIRNRCIYKPDVKGGGGGGGGADVGGINFPSILSKIVVEVIEEKSLRQYIIFITIVPLFNTQHQNLF